MTQDRVTDAQLLSAIMMSFFVCFSSAGHTRFYPIFLSFIVRSRFVRREVNCSVNGWIRERPCIPGERVYDIMESKSTRAEPGVIGEPDN